MTKKLVICQNCGCFAKKFRSVIVSQNHYLKKILDVHPLDIYIYIYMYTYVCLYLKKIYI